MTIPLHLCMIWQDLMTGGDEIIFVKAGWRTLTYDKERSGTMEEVFSNSGLIMGDDEMMILGAKSSILSNNTSSLNDGACKIATLDTDKMNFPIINELPKARVQTSPCTLQNLEHQS